MAEQSRRPRRRFDATWLPFGMLIGFIVGMGFASMVTSNLLIGAGVGFLFGVALGIALGFRPRRGSASDDEDAEDDRYRASHGDPAPRRDDDR